MRRRSFFQAAICGALGGLALLGGARGAQALGMETFGNAPLTDANYTDWPGIMPTLNHSSRVYHVWVNGNENAYFNADAAGLNDLLLKFAGTKTDVREVIFRPGPGLAHSFDRSKELPFTAELHLVGGIAKHLTTLDKGKMVWSAHPVLTIHVTPELDLEKVKVPMGLMVTPLAEVKRRTREGLKSTDQSVRGWSTGVLAGLDPYDTETRDAVAALLKDKDNWVRLNAAGVLGFMGKVAMPTLPQLRETMNTTDEQLKKRAEETIATIEKAPDTTAAEKRHREQLTRIEKYLAAQKG